MRNRKNSRVNDGRNLVQLNVGANPIDAEAQKLGGMFTKKGLGKFVVYCPPNAILVKENRLTGNVTFAKGSGLKFMVPVIYKTYFVLASQVNVDYEKIKYQTLDGIDASIDLALFVRVTDPTKYKINSAKPMEDLKITICECLKNYVRNRTYDNLVNASFDLNAIDQNNALRDFEDANGIKVTGGRFKSIELPEHLKSIFDDQVEAEKRKKVVAVENKIKEEQKVSELKRVQMEIEKYSELVRKVVPDVTDEELMKVLKLKFASNSYFVDGNSNYSSDILRGTVQGQAISQGLNASKDNSKTSGSSYSYRGSDIKQDDLSYNGNSRKRK